VTNPKFSTDEANEAPIVRIVSPLADALIPPGESVGAGSLMGTGFALNLEIITRDRVRVAVTEAADIRDTSLLSKTTLNS